MNPRFGTIVSTFSRYRFDEKFATHLAKPLDSQILASGNNSDPYRLYMVLGGYFGLRQTRKDHEALAFLNHSALAMDNSQWPYQIIKYLRREITPQELLSLAVVKGKRIEVRARVYLGLEMSLSGQRELALEHLRWVRENRTKTSREYTLAASEITRLEAAPKPTPKPPRN